jgi:hypothetical protein
VSRRLGAAGAGLAAALAGCLSERPRPAPPQLSIMLDATTIRSTTPNDTLTGSVRAADSDGLDSLWLQVDTIHVGVDAAFDLVYQNRFRLAVRSGLPQGTQVPVVLQARDVVGFRSQLDTFVTVVP